MGTDSGRGEKPIGLAGHPPRDPIDAGCADQVEEGGSERRPGKQLNEGAAGRRPSRALGLAGK